MGFSEFSHYMFIEFVEVYVLEDAAISSTSCNYTPLQQCRFKDKNFQGKVEDRKTPVETPRSLPLFFGSITCFSGNSNTSSTLLERTFFTH